MCAGRLGAIYVAFAAGGAVEAVDHVEAVPGEGLGGDRYAAGRGTFSGGRPEGREVTLIEAEAAAEGRLDPSETRRNLVTEGVALNDLVGREFEVGEIVLRGVRLCDPCALLERRTRPGMQSALADRGGLRADVVRGGTIRVGDSIRLAPSRADRPR